MVKRALPKILYAAMILLLLVPWFQKKFHLVEEEELFGSFEKQEVELKKLSLKTYRTGEFQQAADEYLSSKIGFKNRLIKLNNQLNYSLFNKTNANDVIIGKNEMLIPEVYIKSYYGLDAISNERIDDFTEKLIVIQDSLNKKNKLLVVMIAPGKVSVYPENVPDKYNRLYKRQENNYDKIKKASEGKGLQLFDMSVFLKQEKAKSKHPVFPSKGLHWSGYSVAKVTDTLLKYLDAKTPYNIPTIQLKEGKTTKENYRFTDYDIGEAMNLLWNVSNDNLYYPIIEYKTKNKKKPTVLGVGDSFIQSFYGFYPTFDSSFSDQSQLWFYNKIIDWPERIRQHQIKSSWLDLKTEIEKTDIVILEMSEENIRQTGYGFVDELYNLLTKESTVDLTQTSAFKELMVSSEINNQVEAIYKDLGYTKEKLKESIAKNKLKSQWPADFDYEAEVKKVEEQLRGNKELLQAIKEKAFQKNITIDESIRLDAEWVVNNNLSK